MGSATDSIFQRLELAISEWSAEIKSSSAGMVDKLARVQDRLRDTPEGAESVDALMASLDFSRAEFARLEVALRECLGAAKSAEDRAGQASDTLDALRHELAGLRQEIDERFHTTETAGTIPARDEALVAEVDLLKTQLAELRAFAIQPSEPEMEESLAAVCGEVEQLRAAVATLKEAGPTHRDYDPDSDALRSEIDALKDDFIQLREQLGAAERGESESVTNTHLAELRNEIGQLREALSESGDTARRVEELEGVISIERERADRLEMRLSEAGPLSVATGISAEVAVELDLLREELADVRAELAAAHAGPATAAPYESYSAPTEPVHPAPAPPPIAQHQAPDINLDLSGFDSEGRRRRMGEILVDAGVLTEGQLEHALQEQQDHPQRRLGAILVELGHTESDVIAQVLACQLRLPFLHLEQDVPEENAIRLVSGRLCRHHHCVPVRIEDETVLLAMSNPLDLIAIEDIELATSRRVNPVVAAEPDIAKAIDWFYGSEA
jgi:predicted  nucleic acid-binding Zn-ribbon protein